MTPKDKAEELITTYRFVLSFENALLGENKDSAAKKCALITVDELLNDCDASGPFEIERINYWEQVKEEINKL